MLFKTTVVCTSRLEYDQRHILFSYPADKGPVADFVIRHLDVLAVRQPLGVQILGVSERTFRRRRDRYEAEGAEGLYDRRLGRASARRAPVDEVMLVLELFDTRYWDFTAKHFHEKLVADHGFKRSYNWLRLSLQAHGRRRAAPRRGAHRRKRERRALPGMMLHQDGSIHEWVPGRWWDLIVTMDDATSEIYSAFFVAEEGTMSSFQGEYPEFCALSHSDEKERSILWQSRRN